MPCSTAMINYQREIMNGNNISLSRCCYMNCPKFVLFPKGSPRFQRDKSTYIKGQVNKLQFCNLGKSGKSLVIKSLHIYIYINVCIYIYIHKCGCYSVSIYICYIMCRYNLLYVLYIDIHISWDDEIPNIWKNKSHVPNHQPDNISIIKKSSNNNAL